MYRRGVLAAATTVALAGCSDLTGVLDGGYVDETLQDEQTASFSADADTRLAVAVTVEEVAEPDEEDGVESDSISFRLDHADDGPIETRSISDSETFEVTTEADGEHIAIVTNGAAKVDIDEA